MPGQYSNNVGMHRASKKVFTVLHFFHIVDCRIAFTALLQNALNYFFSTDSNTQHTLMTMSIVCVHWGYSFFPLWFIKLRNRPPTFQYFVDWPLTSFWKWCHKFGTTTASCGHLGHSPLQHLSRFIHCDIMGCCVLNSRRTWMKSILDQAFKIKCGKWKYCVHFPDTLWGKGFVRQRTWRPFKFSPDYLKLCDLELGRLEMNSFCLFFPFNRGCD